MKLNYIVPIVKLFIHVLTHNEKKLSLNYSFTDKTTNRRRYLAANLETICNQVNEHFIQDIK